MPEPLEIGTRVRVNSDYAREWKACNFEGLTGRVGTVVMTYGDRIDVVFPATTKRGAEVLVTFTDVECLDLVDAPPAPNVPIQEGFVRRTRNPRAVKNHWLYDARGRTRPPPMPMRMGTGPLRAAYEEAVRDASRWAIKSTTNNGTDMNFDPDTMVEHFVIALLGYNTADGTGAPWENPKPLPPRYPS